MKRVLVFEAHGDDMEFFAGGTIAKFAAAGHEVTVVCATDNDKGSFELSSEELRAVRDRELHDAAGVLGVKRVIALGYPDGDLAYRTTPEVLRGEPADARSDLWAVGVLIHELVTGALPFAGASPRGWIRTGPKPVCRRTPSGGAVDGVQCRTRTRVRHPVRVFLSASGESQPLGTILPWGRDALLRSAWHRRVATQSGSVATSSLRTSSAVTPDDSASKLRIRRWRRAGAATARTSS